MSAKEYGREHDRASARLPGGKLIPLNKLICPECGTAHSDTSIQQPPTLGLEWSATCPKGHTWRFFVD